MNKDSRKNWLAKMERHVYGIMESKNSSNQRASETALYLISGLYRAAVLLRTKAFDAGLLQQHRLSCPVIAVGNLTVGGSGKTPMSLYLAEMLKQRGLRPAVISRGYKGEMEKAGGGIVSDGTSILMSPEKAGDEPSMMAAQLRGVPFIVGADRFRAGNLAIRRFSPDIIVLDDAFQHRRLYRDVNLLLVDADTGFGSGHLLPRGGLREPVKAVARADAVILTRCGRSDPSAAIAAVGRYRPDVPVFRSVHRPYVCGWHPAGGSPAELALPADPDEWGWLANARVLAFAGIARNKEFKRMIAEKAGLLADFVEYPDHHAYTNQDLNLIGARAKSINADVILTTQKDFTRIRRDACFPLDLAVIGVSVDLGADENAFAGWIQKRLETLK